MIDHAAQLLAPIGSPEFHENPYPTYAHMQCAGPVHPDEAAPMWHVVGYREVHSSLRDPRLAAARSGHFLSDEQRQSFPALAGMLPDMMVFADPPRHTRLRG